MTFLQCWLIAFEVGGIIVGGAAAFGFLIALHFYAFDNDKWFRWFLPPLDFLGLVTVIAFLCRLGVH